MNWKQTKYCITIFLIFKLHEFQLFNQVIIWLKGSLFFIIFRIHPTICFRFCLRPWRYMYAKYRKCQKQRPFIWHVSCPILNIKKTKSFAFCSGWAIVAGFVRRRPSCVVRKLFYLNISSLKRLVGFRPHFPGMIPGWSPTKVVQMVLIGCISRSRGQKVGFQNAIFKNLIAWNYKVQSFHIWYIASSRGPLLKLFCWRHYFALWIYTII